MTYNPLVKRRLEDIGFLQEPGFYVLVDGQFGSTGKGLAAGLLAEMFHDKVEMVYSNAGPNSGHTNYFNDEQIVLKQLPSFAVTANKCGSRVDAYLDAGAVIAPDTLIEEILEHDMQGRVIVHPHASYVSDEAKDMDASNVSSIGSTGKGTGPAQIKKMMRLKDAVIGSSGIGVDSYVEVAGYNTEKTYFVEVSQGFSLGINSGFYPYTTSRECTVMQALSDANVHPMFYRDSMMVVRTFPIRVAGNSGPCYYDQQEISWDALGVEPEITTVTKKVRRVFTWSTFQFMEALQSNRPGVVLLNFVNYLVNLSIDVDEFVEENVLKPYVAVMGHAPKAILLGYGPKSEDVQLWQK